MTDDNSKPRSNAMASNDVAVLRGEIVRLRARIVELEHVLRAVDQWATDLELYAWPEDQLVPALQCVRDVLEPRPWR